jgi:hypothetical protein
MVSHLVIFADLRRHGASWAQIASLLAAHGIVGSDGALTTDVVRATYARAAKTAEATKRKWTGRNATQRSETNRNNAEKRGETHRNAAECDDEKPDEARANTKPQKQHKAPGAPPDGVKRGRTARNLTGENKSDPPDHGIADLFRRAGFLHTPRHEVTVPCRRPTAIQSRHRYSTRRDRRSAWRVNRHG